MPDGELRIIEKLMLVLVILLAVIVILLIGKNGLVGGSLAVFAGIVCGHTYLTHRRNHGDEKQMAIVTGIVGVIIGVILGPLTMLLV